MSRKEPGRTDLNRRERNCIEMLVVASTELFRSFDCLKDRLKNSEDKRAFSYAKCAFGLINKVQMILYRTVPTRQLQQLKTVCEKGYAEIRMPSAVCPPNYYPISVSDANTIIGAAVNDRCRLCFEDQEFCDNCELRKALLNVHPPIEYSRMVCCPYQGCEWADKDSNPNLEYI